MKVVLKFSYYGLLPISLRAYDNMFLLCKCCENVADITLLFYLQSFVKWCL